MNLFDIPKLEQDLKTLESKTLEDGFWNDSKKSGKVLQEIKVIKNKKDKYLKLESELSNLEEMNELLQLEDDEALVKELLKNTSNIQKEIENLEIETLLSGKYDIIFFEFTPGFSPFIKTSPHVGTNKSLINFINVVFPLPFLPKSPIIFPLGITKSTFCKAIFPLIHLR